MKKIKKLFYLNQITTTGSGPVLFQSNNLKPTDRLLNLYTDYPTLRSRFSEKFVLMYS